MSGHRPYSELTKDWTPERKERNCQETERLLAEMELAELRQQTRVSQVEMAKRLKTAQGAISRLERAPDMRISSLRQYVRAIGGELEVRAIFKDGAIVLSHVGSGGAARRRAAAKKRRRSR